MQRLKAVLCTVPWNCDRTLLKPINALPSIGATATVAAALIAAALHILKASAQLVPQFLLWFLGQCVSLFRWLSINCGLPNESQESVNCHSAGSNNKLLRLPVLSLWPDVGRTFENQQTVNGFL